MIVAAVDPGKMTGVCLVDFIDVSARLDAVTAIDCRLVSSSELEFDGLLDWCEQTMTQAEQVAIENFIITPATGKNTQAPWSLMGIGVVTAICMRSSLPLALQKPVDAKSLVSNDLLRSLKLWHRGGAGHANDALRHAVLYAVRHGWRSKALTEIL